MMVAEVTMIDLTVIVVVQSFLGYWVQIFI